MAESNINQYKRLFEIRLLHHYWLDEGATVFDLLQPKTRREERLQEYDMRSFLAVAPTSATAKEIKGLRGVYKETALGCMVAVPDIAVIPADAVFEFAVTVRDPAFYGYTALTLQPRKISGFYHQPDNKTYRYKENVPVFSNLTGASRGTGVGKSLYLSAEIPALADDDQVESLIISGNALLQLTGDQPGAGTQQLTPQANKLPVYVHQGDAPAVVPPADISGAPSRGIMLTDGIPDNVFALVRLSAVRVDDGDFSLIGSGGHAKATSPVFEIRFKNRSTIWKYINKSTGALMSTEPVPLPLTLHGNAGTKQKPSEGLVKAVKSGDKITQLVSEIFV